QYYKFPPREKLVFQKHHCLKMFCPATSNRFRVTILQLASRAFSSTQSASISNLVRPITVQNCVGLYQRLHQLNPKLYPANAPSGGLELTVEYADSANDSHNVSDFDRTILALHGNPGYWSHFDKIIEHYRGSRVRVIAPT